MMLHLLIALNGLFGIADPAPGDQPARRTALRVASYNTWLMPLVSAEFLQRRAAMPAALDALEPDILCLQEVWDQASLDAIGAYLSRRLPHRIDAGGGLALLSRWPVRAWHFEPFPVHESLSFVERLAKKGFVSAVIETPAGFVRVVTTHLAHARGDARPAHEYQMAALADALGADRRLPTILCGDLNFRALTNGVASVEARMLEDLGFIDPAANPTRAPTRIGWPRVVGRVRGGDPDYVLYRPGRGRTLRALGYRQALDTPESALSDHNLQLVELEL